MEFKEYKLSDLAKYSEKKIELSRIDKKNYISTENMLTNKNGILDAIKLPNQSSVSYVEKGNILISNIRPYFKKIWYADRECGCSNDILNIKNKKKELILSKYLYYILYNDVFFDYVMGATKGTKMPRGDKNHIMKYKILLPSIENQEKIVKILSSLEEKIEFNNKINSDLGEISKLLYKKWFIDFEFSDEDGNPYKSSGGIMFDSELGKIPKDWKVKQLGEVISFINGFSFKSNEYVANGKFKIITIKNVLDGSIIADNSSTIESLPQSLNYECILKKSDILLSLTGNVGRVGIVTENGFLLNQRVAKIIVDDELYGFIYNYLRYEKTKDIMISLSKGTAQKNLSTVDLLKQKISFNNIVAKNYSEICDPLIKMMINLKADNDNLKKAINLLSTKLTKGEINLEII